MTYEEIKELAGHRDVPFWVIKLVGDVISAEREACAKVCESMADRFMQGSPLEGNKPYASHECASAIRTRGEQ